MSKKAKTEITKASNTSRKLDTKLNQATFYFQVLTAVYPVHMQGTSKTFPLPLARSNACTMKWEAVVKMNSSMLSSIYFLVAMFLLLSMCVD